MARFCLTGTINTTNGFTNATGTLTGTGTINDNVTSCPAPLLPPDWGATAPSARSPC